MLSQLCQGIRWLAASLAAAIRLVRELRPSEGHVAPSCAARALAAVARVAGNGTVLWSHRLLVSRLLLGSAYSWRLGHSIPTKLLYLLSALQSGFGGRDNGIHAHDQYCETKTIWIDLTDPASQDKIE